MHSIEQTYVPHTGWLSHETGDDVARYLREGWFEFAEQAMWWLYLQPGDTVIDCGAHVGLFTLLAAKAVGESGRVIALEPNPSTAALLRQNVEAAGARNVHVIEAAAAAQPGTISLNAGAGAASAYSSSVSPVHGASKISVNAITLDEAIAEHRLDSVSMLKIDVEGAELDAWKGCARSIESNRISVAMVEFTEANQQAAGRTTMDLIRAWNADGYSFHRFDPATASLTPADVKGAIEYENLFATRDPRAVAERLTTAREQSRLVARDLIARGTDAHALLKRACDAQHYQDLVEKLKVQLAELQHEHEQLHERLRTALIDRGEFEKQLIDTRHRAHTYAAYIQRILDSRTGRLARSLHLANTPDWLDMMKRDLQQP